MQKKLAAARAESLRLHTELARAERKAAERNQAAVWEEIGEQRKLSAEKLAVAKQVTRDVELQFDDEGRPTLESRVQLELELDSYDFFLPPRRKRKQAVKTPANPRRYTAPAGQGTGFLSIEEYMQTPFEKRHTAKFRERVKRSRRLWPETFDPHDFPRLD